MAQPSFIYRLDSGPNNPSVLNIDFMGGTAYSFELKQYKGIDEIRDVLNQSTLQDKSVDQIWLSDPQYTEGEKSKLFTFRTSEKNVDKVKSEINRLLGKGGEGKDWLKITELSGFLIELKEPKTLEEMKAALDTGSLKGLPIETVDAVGAKGSKMFRLNPGESSTDLVNKDLTKCSAKMVRAGSIEPNSWASRSNPMARK